MGKDKRRNSEKRKEKSRDAARCRRGKESEVFADLADCLPLPENVTRQLDKASIMRLAISVLKIDSALAEFPDSTADDHCDNGSVNDDQTIVEAEELLKETKIDHLYQKALDGFPFILSQDGDFIYLPESVTKCLGLSQIELMGQSIYDFTHPCDHEEIRDMLTLKSGLSLKKENAAPENKTSFLRLKCTLTSKGRNVNLKSASYKVMKCSGRLISGSLDNRKENLTSEGGLSVFPFLIGMAEPIPHPSNIEVPLDCSTFLSKHSMDMKFLVCDERIQELAGYSSDEMIGKSFFDFTHAVDSEVIGKVFKDLFSKGQATTGSYRLLSRNGGYVWVVTQATVISSNRNPKPQFVVCVHFVLSSVEEKGSILSHIQKQAPLANLIPPKLEMSTEGIFAPRTKDMEKGYFVPKDLIGKITYLNNEPEDLSYLAPNAGEDNIPIPFASPEMDYLLSPAPSVDNCVMKLEPTTPSPDPHSHKVLSPMSITSPASSSRMASPIPFSSSAVPADIDSMGQFFQAIDVENESSGLVDNIDFNGRAPYIPMDREEDLEIFAPSSNTLFNFSNDINPGLFGQTEKVFGPKDFLFQEPEPQNKFISLRDMIDGSTAVASIQQAPDTMYLQLKRPLDMNSLEKGPPNKKPSRLESPIQPSLSKGLESVNCKDSVLLNLLLNGEDRHHGYKVCALPPGKQMGTKVPQSPKIPILTRQDCELNAPTRFSPLLQGAELLKALDIAGAAKMLQKSQ